MGGPRHFPDKLEALRDSMYVFVERYGKVSYFASGEGVQFQFIFAGILPMQPGS